MYLRFSTHYYVLFLVSAEHHGCIVGFYSSVIKHENSASHLGSHFCKYQLNFVS